MEETLFECTYKDSGEIIYESQRYVWSKQKVHIGIFLIIAAICLTAVNLWLWLPTWWILIAVMTIIGVFLLLYPKIYEKRTMGQILQENGGKIPVAKVTVSDKLSHQYKLNTFGILFEDVLEVHFLQKCIVVLGKEAYLTFACDGFTKGTPEELEMFLRQKCPDAKFIYKGRKKSTERVL